MSLLDRFLWDTGDEDQRRRIVRLLSAGNRYAVGFTEDGYPYRAYLAWEPNEDGYELAQ